MTYLQADSQNGPKHKHGAKLLEVVSLPAGNAACELGLQLHHTALLKQCYYSQGKKLLSGTSHHFLMRTSASSVAAVVASADSHGRGYAGDAC